MEPCNQENRITRIEGQVSSINGQVAQIASDVRVIHGSVTALVDQVKEHDGLLRGENGAPGLVSQVSGSAEKVDDIVSTLRGHDDKPGIVGKIDKMSETMDGWKDAQKWLVRLAAGAVIGEIILRVLPLLFK